MVPRQRRRSVSMALKCASLLPASLVAQPSVQQRDSVVVRAVSAWQKDVDRLKMELLTQRKMEQEFQKILGALELRIRSAAADSQRSELLGQTRLILGKMQESGVMQLRLRRQLESLCATVRKPEGWLGVVTTGFQLLDRRGDGTTFVRFLEPPVVASVDPGSPAERVGVRAGDVLLELGGQRLLHANVVFADLLRPGVKIAVKLQRGGETVTLLPMVEPLPETSAAPCTWVDPGTAYVLSPMPAQVRIESAPRGTRRYSYSYTQPRLDSAAVVKVAPIVSGSFAGPMAEWFSGGANSLAGLQLVVLSEESSKAMGVDHGILVNQVLPGTPGREAGLQGGDVLVSADSVELRSIGTLQRVISRSADRLVTLVIVRDRRKETVQLRW